MSKCLIGRGATPLSQTNMIFNQSDDDIGKRTGLLKPHLRMLGFLCLLSGLLPHAALASTQYLIDNTEGFLEKIDSSYGQMISIAALLHDYDAKMITAVIVVESEGNESAVSSKGAKGLMQLMPMTAKAMGASNPKDPFQNILAGTKYLKQLERNYGFTNTRDALVAYNMGPSRATRWLSQYDSAEYSYVQKVMYVYNTIQQREFSRARIARASTNNNHLTLSAAGVSARPIMTKPRNIALALLPFTVPLSRKDGVVIEN
ncbi:MAG: Transglycosylase SLT domain protein [Parcubacteria group bacterium GW2011_GWA2_47_7]|nr:MAG: Transglycosylase SLT domain protein [Parcubacteria group bacterium GW2011_GWA2_47_7]